MSTIKLDAVSAEAIAFEQSVSELSARLAQSGQTKDAKLVDDLLGRWQHTKCWYGASEPEPRGVGAAHGGTDPRLLRSGRERGRCDQSHPGGGREYRPDLPVKPFSDLLRARRWMTKLGGLVQQRTSPQRHQLCDPGSTP